MPWVKREDCIGCGMCVEECPVGAISLEKDVAVIDMANCIRCGVCHDVCPEGAVRHDSERIEEEVEENVRKTKECMNACATYLGDVKEKQKCLNRMIKYFNKEKIVIEKTLERLQKLKEELSLSLGTSEDDTVERK
ncbi:MAG: 4Fe-4S binding protein [Thermodesulfobacterium sp.]|nr:4Fe-4S binding protein [Thermodesulfobacterium sp.]